MELYRVYMDCKPRILSGARTSQYPIWSLRVFHLSWRTSSANSRPLCPWDADCRNLSKPVAWRPRGREGAGEIGVLNTYQWVRTIYVYPFCWDVLMYYCQYPFLQFLLIIFGIVPFFLSMSDNSGWSITPWIDGLRCQPWPLNLLRAAKRPNQHSDDIPTIEQKLNLGGVFLKTRGPKTI